MPLHQVYIDARYEELYKRIAEERGQPVENLIEIAAEEAALEYAKSQGWRLPSETPAN